MAINAEEYTNWSNSANGGHSGIDHGKYGSCVAKSSESFVDMGLITGAQKDALVSDAAGSDCGDKK